MTQVLRSRQEGIHTRERGAHRPSASAGGVAWIKPGHAFGIGRREDQYERETVSDCTPPGGDDMTVFARPHLLLGARGERQSPRDCHHTTTDRTRLVPSRPGRRFCAGKAVRIESWEFPSRCSLEIGTGDGGLTREEGVS